MVPSASASLFASIPPRFLPHYRLYPHSYEAPRLISKDNRPLVDRIDGDLSKEEWLKVAWQNEQFDDIRGPDDPSVPPDERPPLGCKTKFKMMWDDEYLYIGVLLESYQREVITSFTTRNEPIYQQDSDFEVFLDPAGSCHFYKELEINAWNTVWNLYLDKPCKYSSAPKILNWKWLNWYLATILCR